MSLIWPLSLIVGMALGVVLSRKGAAREAALGFPLVGVLLSSTVIWVLEAYLAIGGLGHYGVWLFAYGLLVAALASAVYLISYLVTRVVLERSQKGASEP